MSARQPDYFFPKSINRYPPGSDQPNVLPSFDTAGFAFAAERREQFKQPDIVRRVFKVMDEDQAVEDQGK